MHEMSICESLLQILEEEAKTGGYRRVRTVWLEVGPFSGVEHEALLFSFDAVTRGTLAEQARLEICQTEAQAWCLPCGENKTIKNRYDACPTCGSHQLQLTSGEELRIKELEVD
jgi:hydrogenase nickel incorporation protein HypA/HybF